MSWSIFDTLGFVWIALTALLGHFMLLYLAYLGLQVIWPKQRNGRVKADVRVMPLGWSRAKVRGVVRAR